MENPPRKLSQRNSLSPVVLDGRSDEETTAAMKRGKGKTLFAIGTVLIAAAGGLFVFLHDVDETATLRNVGKAINGIKQKQFDRFWGCVLKGQDLRDIRSNADLISGISHRSSAKPLTFGKYVRDKCYPILEKTATDLDALQVPTQLQEPVSEIKKSITHLNESWQTYIVYLTNPELEFEEQTAKPHLNKIASAWYGFRKAHNLSNKLLREQL